MLCKGFLLPPHLQTFCRSLLSQELPRYALLSRGFLWHLIFILLERRSCFCSAPYSLEIGNKYNQALFLWHLLKAKAEGMTWTQSSGDKSGAWWTSSTSFTWRIVSGKDSACCYLLSAESRWLGKGISQHELVVKRVQPANPYTLQITERQLPKDNENKPEGYFLFHSLHYE